MQHITQQQVNDGSAELPTELEGLVDKQTHLEEDHDFEVNYDNCKVCAEMMWLLVEGGANYE
jgi:hypothetical protein